MPAFRVTYRDATEPLAGPQVVWLCCLDGCEVPRAAGALMCGPHWARVPASERAAYAETRALLAQVAARCRRAAMEAAA